MNFLIQSFSDQLFALLKVSCIGLARVESSRSEEQLGMALMMYLEVFSLLLLEIVRSVLETSLFDRARFS
jgi:hypothetical protein